VSLFNLVFAKRSYKEVAQVIEKFPTATKLHSPGGWGQKFFRGFLNSRDEILPRHVGGAAGIAGKKERKLAAKRRLILISYSLGTLRTPISRPPFLFSVALSSCYFLFLWPFYLFSFDVIFPWYVKKLRRVKGKSARPDRSLQNPSRPSFLSSLQIEEYDPEKCVQPIFGSCLRDTWMRIVDSVGHPLICNF